MRVADFDRSSTGRLVPTTHGQHAFVPHTLPPRLALEKLFHPTAAAEAALGTLRGLARRFATPAMIVRPLQRREALTSSSMEGTHTSPDALVLLEAGEATGDVPATREVLNYVTALNEAVADLDRIPISWRLISAVHRRLMDGVGSSRGANLRPGEFKDAQNFIGADRRIAEARFVPPPPAEAREAMTALEHYVNRPEPVLPPLLDAALIHYQFETIHPFSDGNGRVGRILIPLLLIQRGALDTPILYVSPYIEAHRRDYADRLLAVSRDGDWEGWIGFFLEAVRETCSETTGLLDQLLALQEDYRARAQAASRSTSILRIADSLFERPVLSVTDAARIAGVTYAAAQTMVGRLVAAGLLRESAVARQPRLYIATEVVRISSGHFRRPEPDTSRPV